MDEDKSLEDAACMLKHVFDELDVQDPTKPGTKILKTKFAFDNVYNFIWRSMLKDKLGIVCEQEKDESEISYNIRLLSKIMHQELRLILESTDEDTVVIKSVCGVTMSWAELSGKQLWFCE